MKRALILGLTLLAAIGVVYLTSDDLSMAAQRAPGKNSWTHFTSNVQFGDSCTVDTVEMQASSRVRGHMVLDSLLTVNDSLFMSSAGHFYTKGSKISADSSLIFSFSGTKARLKVTGAVLGVDSMRALKKFVGEDGSTALLDSVRVDDGTSFAQDMKVWGTNTLVFKGMRPVMDSASLGSKIRVSQDASIYGANSLALVGAKLTVDTLKVTNRVRLFKNTTLYADSLVILSGGRLQADTIAVSKFISTTGKGPGKTISMADITLTADTIFADTIGVSKVTVKTRLNASGSFEVNALPAVVPMSFAFDDDSLADPGPHFAMVMPRGVSVRYVTVDLSEAVGTAPCTLWVKAAADSAALVVANGTDDTTMACDVVCAAGGSITVTSAKASGSNDGAALGVDAPDCTIWLEWK